MNRPLTAFLMFVVSFFGALDVRAQRPTLDYRCIAKNSDLVLIATPESLSLKPIFTDYMSDLYLISLHVDHEIKGAVEKKARPSKTVDLVWRKDDPHAAQLHLGKQYLVFLQNAESGPFVVNGAQGAVELKNNGAVLHNIFLNRRAVKNFVDKAETTKIDCR